MKIFNENGDELNLEEIKARFDRNVAIAGGKYKITLNDLKDRMKGNHCYCGTDAITNESLGDFQLQFMTLSEIHDTGKCYMTCRKCGAVSHL